MEQTTDTIPCEQDTCHAFAVVGWSHSPDFPPPVWLCLRHFEQQLAQNDREVTRAHAIFDRPDAA